jgi:hypothetical protein
MVMKKKLRLGRRKLVSDVVGEGRGGTNVMK